MNWSRTSKWVMLIYLIVSVSTVTVRPAAAQRDNQIPLWPLAAPMAKGAGPDDSPSFLLYLPSSHQPTPGVVICPSGNYLGLTLDREGRQVAEWLNDLGIAAFVLKYRLAPTYRYPVQLLDAERAVRYVRSNASLYNVVENQIGMMGFSAGGHLAAMVATHYDERKSPPSDGIDRLSSRPDFLVLVYPIITCVESYHEATACGNLLGDRADPNLAAAVSSERHVTAKTPPTFLFHTYDDATVSVDNSLAFFTALRKAGVPAELHVYENGSHGVGLAQDDPVLSTWPTLLVNWFRVRGLLPKKVLP
jgi:acetyl esterase/lipase